MDLADNITPTPAGSSPVAPGTLDRKGVPFDPARHIPKERKVTGGWMPRGGRKAKAASAAGSSSEPASLFPEGSPSSPPTPSAPSPGADTPPTPPPAAETPPPSFADIERAAGAPTPDAKAVEANAVVVENLEMQADTIWKGAYALLGIATGAPDETGRTGAAHANNRDVLAAWMKESGIRLKGGWALLIVVITYLSETGTKPKTAQKVSKWKAWLFPPKQVQAAASPAKTEAAPAAVKQPSPSPFGLG